MVWQAGGMKQATEVPRPTYTSEERAQWGSRFRSSGLPQARFAQRHGLKLTTLQKWLYGRGSRRAPKRQQPTPGFGQLHRHDLRRAGPKDAKRSRATFREITVPPLWSGPASGGWVAEVTWPSGVTVRLAATAETTWIGALLEAVRSAC